MTNNQDMRDICKSMYIKFVPSDRSLNVKYTAQELAREVKRVKDLQQISTAMAV